MQRLETGLERAFSSLVLLNRSFEDLSIRLNQALAQIKYEKSLTNRRH